MAELKPLVCKCCGGTINRKTMKCEYCGTAYERQGDDVIIRVETFRNPVRTFTACVGVDDNEISQDPDRIAYIAMHRLIEELSKTIAPNLVLQTYHDTSRMQTKVYGTIKIVQPVNVSPIPVPHIFDI